VAAPAIEIENVTKIFKLYRDKLQSAKERVIKFGRMPYEEFHALDDVSFDVAEGKTVGILGHNGSGKSTMLKCVTGTLRPTSGAIRTRGRVAALLELGAGFHPELTGRENVYLNGSILGLDKAYIDARFDDIVEFSEIGEFIDNQVKHYSSGMYSRLGFAVAVNVDPDVLLVDEVLSVGDESFQRKCIDRVREFQREGRTILVVSHAADLVRRICDQAVVLDHGKLVTVDEPGPAIRKFRETLMARGIDVATELHDPEDPTAGRIVTQAVRFTGVSIDYPAGGACAKPDDPVTIRMGYKATVPVDDVVFAINVHDMDGNFLLGTNTDLMGVDLGKVRGRGEVAFELDRVPLLDGTYRVSLGIHTHDGGIEYDHREDQDVFEVMNPGETVGIVHFPMRFTRREA
jgi:ABC-2 type transport system ATP-binding protein